MKWLEFVIWVYRETSLRAFCLFLMGLWIISWALVPGPEGAGLEQQSTGERAGLAARETGPWVSASAPCNNSRSAVFI